MPRPIVLRHPPDFNREGLSSFNLDHPSNLDHSSGSICLTCLTFTQGAPCPIRHYVIIISSGVGPERQKNDEQSSRDPRGPIFLPQIFLSLILFQLNFTAGSSSCAFAGFNGRRKSRTEKLGAEK